MYKIFFIIIFAPCIAFAQHQKIVVPSYIRPTAKQLKMYNKEQQCLYRNTFSAKQRRAFYPFNITKDIKLVSFVDTTQIVNPISVAQYVLDYNKLKESKTLTNKGIDSLTDILYNIGYTPQNVSVIVADPGRNCYNPRNAILFMDGNGKVVQYIKYCFECERYFLSSGKIKNTEYCQQKYEIIRKYFLSQGIKFGTNNPDKN